jgi:Histidine kinase-like ATPase domain
MTSMSQGSTEVAWSPAPAGVACRAPVATRRSSLELGVVPAAVRTARHWTANLLAESHPPHDPDFIDTVVLLVSELVTNAIDAARSTAQFLPATGDRAGATAATQPGTVPPQSASRRIPAGKPRVWLAIAGSPEQVRIEVHDSACVPVPAQCRRTADDESGRGLEVIAALASGWGWHPDPHGKVVWCEITVG